MVEPRRRRSASPAGSRARSRRTAPRPVGMPCASDTAPFGRERRRTESIGVGPDREIRMGAAAERARLAGRHWSPSSAREDRPARASTRSTGRARTDSRAGDAPRVSTTTRSGSRSATVQLSQRTKPWIALPAAGSSSGSWCRRPRNSYDATLEPVRPRHQDLPPAGRAHLGGAVPVEQIGVPEPVRTQPSAHLDDDGPLLAGCDLGLRPRGSAHESSRAFCIAASKAIPDGAKSVRRMNASASGAPHSRSMPLSSHSTGTGPW